MKPRVGFARDPGVRRRRWGGWLAVALVLAGGARPAAAGPLADTMRPFVDSGRTAGAVALVATLAEVRGWEAVGWRDLATRQEMQRDSVFWVASQTKPLTTAALMILVDEGRLSVDDPLSKHLPEFRDLWIQVEGDAERQVLCRPKRPLRVRDLLTHHSGMAARSAIEEPTNDAIPLVTRVRSYAMLPLGSEPGEKYLYSNAGINTVGRIIEVVSGQAYAQFLTERVLRPLRMNETTFHPSAAQLARLAKAYRPVDGALRETPIDQLRYPLDAPDREAFPAGGLFSTAADLLNFYRMLAGGGVFEGRRLLSEAAIALMTEVQTTGKQMRSLGLMADGRFYGHGGAYGTHSRFDRRNGLITIFLVQQARWEAGGDKMLPEVLQAAEKAFARP